MIVSIPKLRAALGATPDKDSELEALAESATSLWEELTSRPWLAETGRVDRFNFGQRSTEYQAVQLDLSPVSSVTTVEERWGQGDSWDELESDDWELDGRTVRKNFGPFLPQVRVTYDGGYDVDSVPVPGEVEQAIILQVRFQLSRNASERLITRSQNFEGGQGVFERNDVHPFTAEMARKHKRKTSQF